MSSISSSYSLPSTTINAPSSPSNENISEPRSLASSPHLKCSEKRVLLDRLFQAFVSRGILDINARTTKAYENFSLPLLEKTEIQIILDDLARPFYIQAGEKKIHTSMLSLCRWIYGSSKEIMTRGYPQAFFVASSRLIGKYVLYTLFSKTRYPHRVFHALKCTDLVNDALFISVATRNSDIDLRMHIQNCYTEVTEGKDLYQIGQAAMHQIAWWFAKRYPQAVQKDPSFQEKMQDKIAQDSLKPHVDTGINRFQIINFPNSFFDWILYSELTRLYVFTADDIYLPIESLFFAEGDVFIAPESHRKRALESFLHYLLQFLDTDDAASIDKKGCFKFASQISLGYVPINADLRPALVQSAKAVWFGGNPQKWVDFKENVKKWILKHQKNDALEASIFLFNLLILLQPLLNKNAVQELLKDHDALWEKDPFLRLCKTLILKEGCTFETVLSLVQLAAFFAKEHNLQPVYTDMLIHESHENLKDKTLELSIHKSVIALEHLPETALANLAQVSPLSQECESLFFELFFLICPLKELPNDLAHDLLPCQEKAWQLMQLQSSFFIFLGLLFTFTCRENSDKRKRDCVDRHLLCLSKGTHPLLHAAFEKYLGIEKIETTEVFEQKWIAHLFETGRGSEENGIFVWQQWMKTPTSNKVSFSLRFIKKLASQQPAEAARLLLSLDCSLLPNEALNFLLPCVDYIFQLSKLSLQHDALLEALRSKIHLLLKQSDTTIDKPDSAAKSILWLIHWYMLRGDFAAAEDMISLSNQKGLFTSKETMKLRLELRVLDSDDGLLEQSADTYFQLLKEAKDKKVIGNDEAVMRLIRLIETAGHNCSLPSFTLLLTMVATTQNLRIREKILACILKILSASPILQRTPYASYEKEIVSAIHRLISPHFSYEIRKKTLEECYFKKMPFSNDPIWFDTLYLWSQDLEAIQAFETMQNIFDALLLQSVTAKKEKLNRIKLSFSLVASVLRDHEKMLSLFASAEPEDHADFLRAFTYLLTCDQIAFSRRATLVTRLTSSPIARQKVSEIVVALCQKQLEQGNLSDLFEWLVQTEWFAKIDAFEQAVIKNFAMAAFKNALEKVLAQKEPTKQSAQQVFIFFKKYTFLFPDLEHDKFAFFVGFLSLFLPEGLENVFAFFESSQHKEKARLAYVALIQSYAVLVSPKILPHIGDYKLYAAKFLPLDMPKERAKVHWNLLNTLFRLMKTHTVCLETLITSCREVYFDAMALFNVDACDAHEKELLSLEVGRLEFRYFGVLVLGNKEPFFHEVRNSLSKRFLQVCHNSSYWESAGDLLELCLQHPDLEDVATQLLEYSFSMALKKSTLIEACSFLVQKNKTLIAKTLFQKTLATADLEIDITLWNCCRKILEALWLETRKAGTELSKAAFSQLVICIYSNMQPFKEVLGIKFTVQLLFYNLQNWVNIVTLDTYDQLLEQIRQTFKILSFFYECEPTRALNSIEEVILLTEKYNLLDFCLLSREYLQQIRTSSGRAQKNGGVLYLSEEKCFNAKLQFIQKMVSKIHARESFTKHVEALLQELKQEFPKRAKEIKILENPSFRH